MRGKSCMDERPRSPFVLNKCLGRADCKKLANTHSIYSTVSYQRDVDSTYLLAPRLR